MEGWPREEGNVGKESVGELGDGGRTAADGMKINIDVEFVFLIFGNQPLLVGRSPSGSRTIVCGWWMLIRCLIRRGEVERWWLLINPGSHSESCGTDAVVY